jgi:RecA/RadA recombinase
MNKKFNYYDVVSDINEKFAKKRNFKPSVSVGSNMKELDNDPSNFVVMPDWWEESYGVIGLPFRSIVQVGGPSDSGKTTVALEAMRRAQEQGYGVVYLETEGKTTRNDLIAWGVDPDGVLIDSTVVSEKAWDKSFDMIEAFFERYPKEKLLFIFDSYGNTVSQRDDEIRLSEDKIQPGAHAKVNRVGVGKLVGKMENQDIAALIINYNYANIGSVGSTMAGGRALFLWSSLIISTIRKRTLYRQVKGEKIKDGIVAKFAVEKNHLCKNSTLEDGTVIPKEIEVKISADGIERI